MALRKRRLASTVVGIGRREVSLRRALHVGAIDKATLSIAEGVRGADMVILATAPATYEGLLKEAAHALRPHSILTDVASTKVGVIETIIAALEARPDVAYVPTHPMAGSEKQGPLAARADMFEGAVCIITPLTNTFPNVKSVVVDMWKALGARLVSMTPQGHDRLVARISHVPHLLAATLMQLVTEDEADLSGGGLRDSTRIAISSPELWIDICRENRQQIQIALEEYIKLLQQTADCLDKQDFNRLKELLQAAKAKRDRLS
ncbi:MAG: prephenate dehydrogenase/arogenate dehydrogenase family protein [Planctomycetes bacterium]|nr:prephenate dehydrogenase/arogenate dehydrogenase family protein [Planctomycetota bacterium]